MGPGAPGPEDFMGDGTARGGRLICNEDFRWVQIPHSPPSFVAQ